MSENGPHRRLTWEWIGIASLAAMGSALLAVSWRKWPDPLLDFGRELYTPWRLSSGAVFHRDVEGLFGPLSQHWNSLVFRITGPGLMPLVYVNLAIYVAILAALYVLFRRGWGPQAAWAACALFVAVFSFSQLVPAGNYNFVTPYAHETTHGFLVCLLLVWVLVRWIDAATAPRAFAAGLLFGLACVLKPEVILAAILVTCAALACARRSGRRTTVVAAGPWLAGAVLPTAFFTVLLARHQPWSAALTAASGAWWNVISASRFTGDPIQKEFLGLDRPWLHAGEHALATALLVAAFAAAGCAAWWCERRRAILWSVALAAPVAVGALWWSVKWTAAGRCLPGFALLYVVVTAARWPQRRADDAAHVESTRLLIGVTALALMARMALNGRIYQYGFWQAALAGMLVPAVMLGELPRWTRAGSRGFKVLLAGAVALLAPVVVVTVRISSDHLSRKTFAVGYGVDRFLAFPPEINPVAAYLVRMSDSLVARPADETLLVLPEGLMLNYLARKASPVAPCILYSGVTANGGEARLVAELERAPPEWVAVISRDLTEYGIRRYGESPGSGQLLLEWVTAGYVATLASGRDPLDPVTGGAALWRRR